MPALRASPWYRIALALLAAVLAVLLLTAGPGVIARAFPTAFEDYWRYFAACHLAARGVDPYSGAGLEALRSAIPGLRPERIVIFAPPWTLPLMAPFALLPYTMSRLAWFLASIALVLVAARVVWTAYGGSRASAGVAFAMASLSLPTLIMVRQGQIDPWILLGLAGFLHYTERRRADWLAGASLALMSLKPQLLVGVWVACAAWIVARRRWKVALGCATGIALGTLLVMARDPAVIRQFLEASARPPAEWMTPTIGYYLRLAFGADKYWLHAIGPACVAIFSAWYWLRTRRSWTWARALPVLLWGSVLGAAHAWTYDQVVLLVPLLAATAALLRRGWTRKAAVWLGALALLTLAATILHASHTDEFFVWLAPALLAWWWAARRAADADAPAGATLEPIG